MAPKLEIDEMPVIEARDDIMDLHLIDMVVDDEDEEEDEEWYFEEGAPLEVFARHVARSYEEGSLARRCFDRMILCYNSGSLRQVDFIETVLIVFEADEVVMKNIDSLLEEGSALIRDRRGRWVLHSADGHFYSFARREDLVEMARRHGASILEFILNNVLV